MDRKTVKQVNRKGEWDDSSDDDKGRGYSTKADAIKNTEPSKIESSAIREEEIEEVDKEQHAVAILNLLKQKDTEYEEYEHNSQLQGKYLF